MVGHESFEEPGAGRKGLALHEAVEIFDHHGHAAEGSVGQVTGGGPGSFVHRVHHRVQRGVHRLDAGDGFLDQFERLDLAAADEGGQLGGVTGDVVVHVETSARSGPGFRFDPSPKRMKDIPAPDNCQEFEILKT